MIVQTCVFAVPCQERLGGDGIVIPSDWLAITYRASSLRTCQSSLIVTSLA